MKNIRLIGAFAAIAGLLWTAAGPAAAMSGDMKMKHGAMSGGGRFGGTVNKGAPNLPLTLSVVVAGGGPKNYKTTTLLGVLAGEKTKAEVASLSKKFGAKNVTSFVTVFDFVIADSLKIVTKAKVALPKDPEPDPTDGKALAGALYTAGLDEKKGFNVEYMLDSLVTHPVHVQVMKDIDAKYGVAADANYHIVLLQAMKDLKAVYGL